MVTVNPYGVLVVVVLFLPTGSSYGAINPISECNFELSIKKSRRDTLLVIKQPTPPHKKLRRSVLSNVSK
jgi:hypothetical protein